MAQPEITIAEIRAKTFLSDMMGEKRYNKFIKDGKIEIKSGKYTYILDRDGKIINKTKKQSYCITSTVKSSYLYPLFDVIAIRYCWARYKNDVIEKVANKRDLSYTEIIEKLPSKNLFNGMDINLMILIVVLIMSSVLLIYVIFRYA